MGGPVPKRGPGQGGQDGFTLVELLVTIVIIGAAFVILVAGTLVGVAASGTHRDKANGEIVLQRFVDHVKLETTSFADCPGAAYVPPPNDWQNGYILSIGPDISPPDPGADGPTDACVELVPDQPQHRLQRLTLVVEPENALDKPENARRSVQIVKRDG